MVLCASVPASVRTCSTSGYHFSAFLEALLEMQPIFHDQVVTSYVDLVAAAADVPLNDVEYGINATDMTVVDLAVMFPPQGKQPIAA